MKKTSKLPINHRPLELVFVRHGESEGNLAVEKAEQGDASHFTDDFKNRHSSTWNLTSKGEEQAIIAGEWIKKNISDGKFDGYFCSTYKRAKRTAGLLGLPDALWYVRDYIREHDWGNLDAMTDEERRVKHPDVMKRRDINKYYFAAPGGESLADVIIRVRVGILTTLYREFPNKTALVVSHGNIMWPIRIIMESLLPEQFQEIRDKQDPKDKIYNCQIIQYSRVDPFTKEITQRFDWVRSVCPWDLSKSRNEWQRIEHKKYSNEELVRM